MVIDRVIGTHGTSPYAAIIGTTYMAGMIAIRRLCLAINRDVAPGMRRSSATIFMATILSFMIRGELCPITTDISGLILVVAGGVTIIGIGTVLEVTITQDGEIIIGTETGSGDTTKSDVGV